jgi:hypothetical protein
VLEAFDEDEVLREGVDLGALGTAAGAGADGATVATGGAATVGLGALVVASLIVDGPVAELASARAVGEALVAGACATVVLSV